MSALGFLAVSSMLAGGLPAFPRGRRRRVHKPDPVAEARAAAKRARKAAKREEDARRTAEGRASAAWAVGALGMPYRAGFWDYHEGVWSGHYSGRLRTPPRMWLDVREPRWRQRLSHRRSLPWVGRTWFDSEAQFFRTRTPRSYMTRAWRSMAKVGRARRDDGRAVVARGRLAASFTATRARRPIDPRRQLWFASAR